MTRLSTVAVDCHAEFSVAVSLGSRCAVVDGIVTNDQTPACDARPRSCDGCRSAGRSCTRWRPGS